MILSPVVKVAFPLVGIWGSGELGEGFEVLLIRLLCEQDLVSEKISITHYSLLITYYLRLW